ncbi:MAG TPA: DUF2156 domain-containing protein [Planctomycetaceae bacterium]|jgi:lysylphosphatidylglycerol synthetase-like protein (DUF2156 family)|nr:DUF2156 domain-containing protein [Planctomycetaceae bacterium]
MIARNNSQGPHASRWRGKFDQVSIRPVGTTGAVSARPDNGEPSRHADAVDENSIDGGRSIVLGHGVIDEPIPRIDPALWRMSRSHTAFNSASPTLAEETFGSSRLFEVFRQYGNFTMAYATLQPGMKYFESDGGYLAYDTWGGITFVLGDPVAPAKNHAAIIEAFVRTHPRTCFCQISKPVGAILARLGWLVNEFGAEMELDLPRYDFEGPKKNKFRQAAHKIEREGYTIGERTVADADRTKLDALTSSWLAAKTVKHEARFLVRPLAFGDEPAVRKFYLRDRNGSIVAFVAFDPICEAGEVIGYSPAIKRRAPDAPTGAEEAITKFAIERFRAEGLKTYRLGLLPLYDVQDSEFREAWLLKKAFQFAYRYGDRWIFSFRGHADFKHRYRGNLSKVYFATYTRLNAWNLIALLRLCRLH